MSTAASRRSGAHRAPRPRPGLRVVAIASALVVVLVAAVAGGAWWLLRDTSGQPAAVDRSACTTRTTLRVAVDPAVASVVAATTADLAKWRQGGPCVTAQVDPETSADTADTISRAEGVGLADRLPDIWIPDSSVWLAQARSTSSGGTRLADASTSLAESPVVVAMNRTSAARFSWPNTTVQWSQLVTNNQGLRVGTGDPRSTGPALIGLLSVLGNQPTDAKIAAVSSRLAVPAAGGRTPAELVADGVVDAMPTSEVDVVTAQNRPQRKGKVVAVYDAQLGSPLDFPMVVVAHNGTDQKAVTEAYAVLERALKSQDAMARFQAAGLRGADEVLPSKFGTAQGVVNKGLNPKQYPTGSVVASAVNGWSQVGRRFRLTVVVDRSGSMFDALPGGSTSKTALAQRSVRSLVQSASPDSDIGLWSFTTRAPGGDVRELVDLRPLAASVGGRSQRTVLDGAIPGLKPNANGDTPLYRAIKAAYAAAQKDYSFGRLNAIVLVTDGKNDDPGGASPTLAKLVDDLRLTYDGMRPVRIIALGYGATVDLSALRTISDVTGGHAYQGLTEQAVAKLLATGLAQM